MSVDGIVKHRQEHTT